MTKRSQNHRHGPSPGEAPNRAFGPGWFALGALVLAACAGGAPPPPEDGPATSGAEQTTPHDDPTGESPERSSPGLALDLSVESEVMFGDREQLVHVVIVNTSDEEVTADEIVPELRVDGRPAMRLDLATRGFSRIAPGETAEFDQPLGVRLLSPGRHTLSLDVGETHSLPLHIMVRE